MRGTRLANESEEYRSRRDEPRSLEIESMKLRERVAEARRQLPHGPPVRAYARRRGWHNLKAIRTPPSRYSLETLTVRWPHFYTAHPRIDSNITERGIDLLTPVYNMLTATGTPSSITDLRSTRREGKVLEKFHRSRGAGCQPARGCQPRWPVAINWSASADSAKMLQGYRFAEVTAACLSGCRISFCKRQFRISAT